MAYQMTVTLTEQEYQDLVAEATKSGKQPEAILHDLIHRLRGSSQENHSISAHELTEKLYREGKLASLATRRPLSQEEKELRKQLIERLSGGKPASEMVIEDRGPY